MSTYKQLTCKPELLDVMTPDEAYIYGVALHRSASRCMYCGWSKVDISIDYGYGDVHNFCALCRAELLWI